MRRYASDITDQTQTNSLERLAGARLSFSSGPNITTRSSLKSPTVIVSTMAPAATGKASFVDNLLGLVSRPALTPPQVGAVPAPTTHPLDPLTAVEISAAGKACRLYGESLGLTQLRFNSISLEVGIDLMFRHGMHAHLKPSLRFLFGPWLFFAVQWKPNLGLLDVNALDVVCCRSPQKLLCSSMRRAAGDPQSRLAAPTALCSSRLNPTLQSPKSWWICLVPPRLS